MARSMNNFAILVRSKHKGNRKSDTVADLVDHWKRSNEMGKSILELLSLKVCYSCTFKKHENCRKTYCKLDKSKYSSYKVHKGCEKYRDLAREIQHSYPKLLPSRREKVIRRCGSRVSNYFKCIIIFKGYFSVALIFDGTCLGKVDILRSSSICLF